MAASRALSRCLPVLIRSLAYNLPSSDAYHQPDDNAVNVVTVLIDARVAHQNVFLRAGNGEKIIVMRSRTSLYGREGHARS